MTPTVKAILREVADKHGVDMATLTGGIGQHRSAVVARREAIFELRAVRAKDGRHRYSLERIGQIVSRHHTSVIHALRRHSTNPTPANPQTTRPETGDWVDVPRKPQLVLDVSPEEMNRRLDAAMAIAKDAAKMGEL